MENVLRPRIPTDDKAWWWSPRGATNRARLAAVRGRFHGRRCFIVGNGPSLHDTDITLLRDEWAIGLNRIYLHPVFETWKRPLYCCVNSHVLEQFGDEIEAIAAPKFLPWEQRGRFGQGHDRFWLRTRHEPRFSFDLTDAIWQGATVTYVAMQVAFYLGFTDVILVGVDHCFVTAGQPNSLVEAAGDDTNHFAADYFGPGVRWQLPDLVQSESAYRLARQAFEQEGRRIRDATIGGQLDVFPKANYKDLF
ncbi:MAG: hypothetical protein AAF937_05065 [Planctomycetota bacterium]